MSRNEVPQHIRDGFVRQRRNLMALSLIIFLLYHWDAKFTVLNILGTPIDISNGQNVFAILWVLLVYWIWRYANYIFAIGDLGIVNEFVGKRIECLESILNKKPRLGNKFLKKVDLWNENISSDNIKEMEKIRISPVDVINVGFLRRDFVYEFRSVSEAVTGRGDNVKVKYKASFVDILRANLKSMYHIFNQTRLFSEYILPPILPAILFAYWLLFV